MIGAMNELSLASLANIAEIIGASTIVTGAIFGWVHLRHLRAQQRDAVASNLMQTFYSRDLAQAIALVQTLPDSITLAQLREKGPEYEAAAVTVCTSFETMGLLVHRRIAPFDLVLDLAGGVVTAMRRKLRRYLEDLRAEQAQPSWGEWFEWLGDQAEKAKPDRAAAHIALRDWQP